MQVTKAILVDDELNSLQNLQIKIQEYCPTLKVVATTQVPEEAIKLIQQYKPDVIFLDIEMPRMSGFKMLENPVRAFASIAPDCRTLDARQMSFS